MPPRPGYGKESVPAEQGRAMEFTIKSGSPEKQRSACVVGGVFDNRKLSLSAELIDRELRSWVKSAVKLLNETGSYEAVIYLTEEKVKRREVAWRVEHAVVVAMEAVYRFDRMKSEKAEVRRPLRKLTLSVPQRSDLTDGEAAAARGLA